jgi:endonuclease/exonuclease/phosphatase family metal-dependent hydrolase
MVKNGLQATGIQRLPTERGIACKINGIHTVNVYAPSGAEQRKERERFFKSELPWLLPTTECELLLAGDFNCIIRKDESSVNRNISSSLEQLIRGFQLHDAWEQKAENRGFTYHTITGASRLDRIYISQGMKEHKKGIEILAAAFTDHMAVTIHLASNHPLQTHGRGIWCMNLMMLKDTDFMNKVRELWTASRA